MKLLSNMKNNRHSIKLKVVLLSAMLCLVVSCSSKDDSGLVSSSTAIPQVVASASLSTPEIEQHEINPLTGLAPITGQQEGTRPIAIMVGNIQKSMPQAGIASADVIYETEIEAGLTAMMALYSDPAAIIAAGPVTLLRYQFAELAMAQNAILVHIDSNSYANDLLNYFGYQNIDGMYTGTTTFNLDLPRSRENGNENSWYTSSTLISTGIANNAISPIGGYNPIFNFALEGESVNDDFAGVASSSVNFSFSTVTSAEFKYNSTNMQYDKYYAGTQQMDDIAQTQLSFDNLVILFCDTALQPDNLTTSFVLTQGEGVYINGGKSREIKWQKGAPDDQLRLMDENNEDILIHTGKTYIAFVSNTQIESLVIA